MQNLVLFPYVHLHTTTFRVWKNNIGERGIKDFFRGGNQRRGGLFEKSGAGGVGDKYPIENELLEHDAPRQGNLLKNMFSICSRHCFQAVVTKTNVPFYPLYQIYTVKK